MHIRPRKKRIFSIWEKIFIWLYRLFHRPVKPDDFAAYIDEEGWD